MVEYKVIEVNSSTVAESEINILSRSEWVVVSSTLATSDGYRLVIILKREIENPFRKH